MPMRRMRYCCVWRPKADKDQGPNILPFCGRTAGARRTRLWGKDSCINENSGSAGSFYLEGTSKAEPICFARLTSSL